MAELSFGRRSPLESEFRCSRDRPAAENRLLISRRNSFPPPLGCYTRVSLSGASASEGTSFNTQQVEGGTRVAAVQRPRRFRRRHDRRRGRGRDGSGGGPHRAPRDAGHAAGQGRGRAQAGPEVAPLAHGPKTSHQSANSCSVTVVRTGPHGIRHSLNLCHTWVRWSGRCRHRWDAHGAASP